jgi:hypothetical protein
MMVNDSRQETKKKGFFQCVLTPLLGIFELPPADEIDDYIIPHDAYYPFGRICIENGKCFRS